MKLVLRERGCATCAMPPLEVPEILLVRVPLDDAWWAGEMQVACPVSEVSRSEVSASPTNIRGIATKEEHRSTVTGERTGQSTQLGPLRYSVSRSLAGLQIVTHGAPKVRKVPMEARLFVMLTR